MRRLSVSRSDCECPGWVFVPEWKLHVQMYAISRDIPTRAARDDVHTCASQPKIAAMSIHARANRQRRESAETPAHLREVAGCVAVVIGAVGPPSQSQMQSFKRNRAAHFVGGLTAIANCLLRVNGSGRPPRWGSSWSWSCTELGHTSRRAMAMRPPSRVSQPRPWWSRTRPQSR